MRSVSSAAKRVGLLALLLAGCASPVGIDVVSPRQVQRYLTRSALTANEPSDASKNELRRYGLLVEFDDDPLAALAELHEAAAAQDFPRAALFALSELWFLRADSDELQTSYASSLVYAYAFLFPEDERPPLDPLDPRERVAADLYNRALTLAFRRTKQGTLALDGRGEFELEFAHVSIAASPEVLHENGSELYDLQPVAEFQVKGLQNRYRSPGIGAPLAAKVRPLPGELPPIPMLESARLPVTAVIVFDAPIAGLRARTLKGHLEVVSTLDTTSVEIDGRAVPLESETTAALAAGLSESQFWRRELQAFLGNAVGVRKDSGLLAMRPYRPTRIPAVFVHGTNSSPGRWADLVNDLIADPRLRDRYAFWFFSYDSGNPIAYSGYQLRAALTQVVARADPERTNPCTENMIVLGHSQGGLLTKLTAIDAGNAFWENLSSKPFDQVGLNPADKKLLSETLFVKPLPFVKEVIFLATPQRGSYLAGPQIVRRIAEYFVRLPSDVVRVGADLATKLPRGEGGLSFARMPTSIDNMSPTNQFIVTLAEIPVSPGVIAHSIIAVDSDGPLDKAGDGVVRYESAHISGVDSELVVHSPHSGMQSAPATVEEVRRIFLAHSARSACPLPAP
ncbi:MAG: alpha/beta hydrolase [Myxococcota bacterium]